MANLPSSPKSWTGGKRIENHNKIESSNNNHSCSPQPKRQHRRRKRWMIANALFVVPLLLLWVASTRWHEVDDEAIASMKKSVNVNKKSGAPNKRPHSPHSLPLASSSSASSSSTSSSANDSINKNSATIIPNVQIVGVQKAGTTTVWKYIVEQVGKVRPVCVGKLPYRHRRGDKESHYVDNFYKEWKDVEAKPDALRSAYSQYFNLTDACRSHPARIVLDATPILPYPERLGLLYDQDHPVKLIIVLREPADREYSFYRYQVQLRQTLTPPPKFTDSIVNDTDGSLLDFRTVMEQSVGKQLNDLHGLSAAEYQWSPSHPHLRGLYARYLPAWTLRFSDILVLRYEELVTDPVSFQRRILRYLNVTDDLVTPQLARSNGSRKKKFKTVEDCQTVQSLAQEFAPYNQELYCLMDKRTGPDMEERPFPPFPAIPSCDEELV